MSRQRHIEFTVLGHPQTAGSKRAFKTKTGKLVVTDDNAKTKGWQQMVGDAAAERIEEEGLDWAISGPLAVEITFTVMRPKGHYGVKGLLPSAPAHPDKRPDVLKLARAVEDALTGIVWRDDAQIVDEHLQKQYGEPERANVVVYRLEATQAVPETLTLATAA